MDEEGKGWISVKDELPKDGEWVLMGSSTHDFVETGLCLEKKFVNPDLNYLPRPTVTHWMEMPEPPKEKSK